MFWKHRNRMKRDNLEVLSFAVDAFPDYAQVLVDLHERLEAIDPDYCAKSIHVSLDLGLLYTYQPSKYATDDDQRMMLAAFLGAAQEVRAIQNER